MRADIQPLAMHRMVFEPLRAHGLERACADMQGDITGIDAAFTQHLQQCLVEMQTRGRRRNRTGLARIDRLIALVVGGLRSAIDIGWQRHAPDPQQQFLQRLDGFETQPEEFAVTAEHTDFGAVVQEDARTHLRFLANPELRARLVRAGHALDQDLDRATTFLVPEQSRRQHAGIVEDEQVAGAQQRRQIGEAAILETPRSRIDDQQPARRALGQRALRNHFGRQIEMEVGLVQGARLRVNRLL